MKSSPSPKPTSSDTTITAKSGVPVHDQTRKWTPAVLVFWMARTSMRIRATRPPATAARARAECRAAAVRLLAFVAFIARLPAVADVG